MNWGVYTTSDVIGKPDHGGGAVTGNEYSAFQSVTEPCHSYSRNGNPPNSSINIDWNGSVWDADDWMVDQSAFGKYFGIPFNKDEKFIAHFYSGTFSRLIDLYQSRGVKVSYTAAAHSIEEGRREHELLGLAYDYPHLTDPKLWERYVRGYLQADRLIVPSTHSRDVMISFGANPDKIRVIPHGVNLPSEVKPLPEKFTVGYLGAYGPDKGVIYLLQAWEKLRLPDAKLVLGGRDSVHPFTLALVKHFCPNVNVECTGWITNVSDFYNSLSLYVQPSVTEGFGIEILEAMAHGRPVIASTGAGGSDVLRDMKPYSTRVVEPRSVDDLVDAIQTHLDLGYPLIKKDHEYGPVHAEKYTWDKIRQFYINEWKELIGDTNQESK